MTATRDLRANPGSDRIPALDLRRVPREAAMAGKLKWSDMWPAERREYRRRYLERRNRLDDTPAGYIPGRGRHGDGSSSAIPRASQRRLPGRGARRDAR